MKRNLSTVVGSTIALAAAGLVLAAIVPSCRFYDIASVKEARSWGPTQNADIVVELGDTNGPFRLKGGAGGGAWKSVSIQLRLNGRTTNWSVPASNNTGFVVTKFENRRGNEFAIVRKAKY